MNQLKQIFFLFFLTLSVNVFSQTFIEGLVRDAKTKAPLSFANVAISPTIGTITNEEGKFILNIGLSKIDRITVSFVGYETVEIPYTLGQQFYVIDLKSESVPLNQVVVKGTDEYALTLLWESIVTSRKFAEEQQNSKVFRRTTAVKNDTIPAEFMEAFYNARMESGGLQRLFLKTGRMGLPVNTYVVNLDVAKSLEDFKIFGLRAVNKSSSLADIHSSQYFNKSPVLHSDYPAYFYPPSPLNMNSKENLRGGFYVRFSNKYAVKNDTIFEISFFANQSGKAFDGQAYVRQSNKVMERVSLKSDSLANITFETVLDPENNEVTRMGAAMEFGFTYHEGRPVPEFQQLVLDFKIGTDTSKLGYTFKSNTKLFFYDYDNGFQLPFFSSGHLNDYEKVWALPYNEEFWKYNKILEETDYEKDFRKALDHYQLFLNSNKKEWIFPMLFKKFEHWRPDWELDTIWVRRKPHRIYNTQNMIKQNNLNGQTMIFLDYNCFPDTVTFLTEVVLDYRFSHAYFRDSLSFEYLKNYLEIAKAHANVLEQDLNDFYFKKCPKRKWVYKKLDKAIRRMNRHLDKYHRKTQQDRSLEDLKLWEKEIEDLRKRSKMLMGKKM